MGKIERCYGISTGLGYLVGSGGQGLTEELDQTVEEAARHLSGSKRNRDTDEKPYEPNPEHRDSLPESGTCGQKFWKLLHTAGWNLRMFYLP